MFCWQSIWKKGFEVLLTVKALVIAECLSGRFPWCFCSEIGMSLGHRDTLEARKPGLCSWGGGCLAGLERTLVSVLSITFVIVRRATRRPWTGVLGSRWTCLVVRTPGARAVWGGAGVSEPGGPIQEGVTPQRQRMPRGLQRPGFRAARHPGCTCGAWAEGLQGSPPPWLHVWSLG